MFQTQPYHVDLPIRQELQFLRLLRVCPDLPVASLTDLVCPNPYTKQRLAGTKLPSCFKTINTLYRISSRVRSSTSARDIKNRAEFGAVASSLQRRGSDALFGGDGREGVSSTDRILSTLPSYNRSFRPARNVDL